MINCDAVKRAALEIIAAEFFAKTMLSYSFSTNNLYNVIHWLEFGADPNCSDDSLYDRKYQMERSNRRINRIAVRMKIDREPKNGAMENYAGAIFEPKYYDSIMMKGMLQSYNRIAELIGRPTVRIVTDSLIQRADLEEDLELCKYDDYWVKCGYCTDIRTIARKGITLPEVIFYTAIYMSTYTRSLWTLNKALNTESDYRRARHWYESFIHVFKGQSLYEAVIWELFDKLFEKIQNSYEEICECNIQKFWLDEKYRNRKDRARVLRKLSAITHSGKVSSVYLDKQLEAHPERIEDYHNTFNTINILEMLLYDIVPRAEMIALGKMAKPKKVELRCAQKAMHEAAEKACADKNNDLLQDEYMKAVVNYEELQYGEVAAWLADIVCKTVRGSYAVAEMLLQHLPESIAWKTAE